MRRNTPALIVLVLGGLLFPLSGQVDRRAAATLYERGVRAEAAGQLDDALDRYSEVLNVDPRSTGALRRRGIIYFKQGKFQLAAADLALASEITSNDTEVLHFLGDARLALKQYPEAAAAYQRMLGFRPGGSAVYRSLAEAYVGIGDIPKALDAFSECIRLKLDNPEPYLERGRLYAKQAKYRDALEDYDRAIALKPDYAEAFYARGHAQGQLGYFDKAAADFTRALELHPEPGWPDRASALMFRAAARESLSRNDEALADYAASLQANPDNARALLARADLLARLGRTKEAFEDRNKAVEVDPTNGMAYIARGSSYHSMGEHQKGMADRTRAIDLDPNNSLAWFSRGSAHFLLREYRSAISDLSIAERLDPSNAEYKEVSAKAKAALEQMTAGETATEREKPPAAEASPAPAPVVRSSAPAVRDSKPGAAESPAPARAAAPSAAPKPPLVTDAEARRAASLKLLASADLLVQMGRPNEALAERTKAIEADPTNAQAYIARGASYHSMGEHQKGLADRTKAIELDPGNAESWYLRGSARFLLRDYENASLDLSNAAKLSPTNALYREAAEKAKVVLQAEKARDTGNAQQKRSAAEPARPAATGQGSVASAKPQSSGNAETHHQAGRNLLQSGKFQQAVEELTLAVQMNPRLALAWNARGYAYMRLAQWQKAVADFDQALSIDPNYANARRNRESAAAQVKK